MFKFLGTKLFGAKKQESQKGKHRLTVSIPSTKYDPPPKHHRHSSKHTATPSSTKSPQPPPQHQRAQSVKVSTKYKPPNANHQTHQKTKSQISAIQPLKTKNGLNLHANVKAASSSALTSPFRAPPTDPSRAIFQSSNIYHTNSSLKFEITIQYQQQMWTVYKTLLDFIELHKKLQAKYGILLNAPPSKSMPTSNDDDKSNHSELINSDKTEVPPLLPLGLFYLYFHDELSSSQSDIMSSSSTSNAKSTNKKDKNGTSNKKYSPKHVYKQIYQYHQQQIMLQKRQEAQLMQQMKQIQHIRQIQHEQQQLIQQRQLQQLQKDAPNDIPSNLQNNLPRGQSPALKPQKLDFNLTTSSSLPLQGQLTQHQTPKIQPMSMNHNISAPSMLHDTNHHHIANNNNMSTPNTSTPSTPLSNTSTNTSTNANDPMAFRAADHPRLNRSVFDAESPFLKHMRVSLQIWLRVIVDDPMLMVSPELCSFIQFRWIYQADKARSDTYKKSKSSKSRSKHHKNQKEDDSELIVGGVHAPDTQSYFDKMNKKQTNNTNKTTRNGQRSKDNRRSNLVGGLNFDIMNSLNDRHESEDIQRPTLSDFTLLKVVGKGAFGKVLQVRRVDDGSIYAMKILKKENVIKRNQIEHTKTERRVLGYVKHPFIVSLYYAFQTETKLFLVLDYCGGGELFFHLGKAGRFKEDRARFYAASIALALEYLHSKNIIYRDLKPENVLLDNDGHIKLTDFGLSKENITDTNLAHSFCGTPEYLAPEILRRCGHGKPADWWSLGALLYEMLTGMPPFYSRDRDRLFEKILHSKLRFPNYFSDAAVNILTLLMQRNWKKRLGSYQSSNPSKYNDDPKKKSFAQLKGAQQIKRHIFFKAIDWKLLYERKLKPPFIPKLNDDQTNNFDAEFTEMPIYSMDANERSRYIHREKRKYLLKFESFTYIRDENLLDAPEDSGDSDNENEDDEDEEEEAEDSSTSGSHSSGDSESDEDDDDEEEDDDDGVDEIVNEDEEEEEEEEQNDGEPAEDKATEIADAESQDSEQSDSPQNPNDGNDDGFEVFQ